MEGRHVNRTECLNAVNEFFYQGEVLGEAFFAYCVAHETENERRRKWATLLQLETETKARLWPFMLGLGLSVARDDVAARIAEISAGFAAKSWQQHMRDIDAITSFYLEKFRAIEAAAPEGVERDMARAMISHETALNDFAKHEFAGDNANSLADVTAQLHWPLSRG
jgi:hypothetical protein